ncbi:ras-related protein Rab-20 isoform X3 [Sceloporus undulatus]|uniref:ras-related protein Rab-20 isoform X3 n=1 Tax=Sceloporus undulatus TaxID=8520 RepID=UPI001C4B47A9|nr:ras-related protein Rab-20 isoform X3 [Sceloporus undulatus]
MKPDGKVVLLGDMNVGKTSLLHRYMERRFADTVSTVGGAFYLKQWGAHNLSVWDTAVSGLPWWLGPVTTLDPTPVPVHEMEDMQEQQRTLQKS